MNSRKSSCKTQSPIYHHFYQPNYDLYTGNIFFTDNQIQPLFHISFVIMLIYLHLLSIFSLFFKKTNCDSQLYTVEADRAEIYTIQFYITRSVENFINLLKNSGTAQNNNDDRCQTQIFIKEDWLFLDKRSLQKKITEPGR